MRSAGEQWKRRILHLSRGGGRERRRLSKLPTTTFFFFFFGVVMAPFRRLQPAGEPFPPASYVPLRRGSMSVSPARRRKRKKKAQSVFRRARALFQPWSFRTTETPAAAALSHHDKLLTSVLSPRSSFLLLPLFHSANSQVVHADNTGRLRTPFECVQREVRGGNRAAFCFNFLV